MNKIAISLILVTLCGCQPDLQKETGQWKTLFNGKDLAGWKGQVKSRDALPWKTAL